MNILTIFGIVAAVLLGAVLLAALIFAFTKIFGLTFIVLRNFFRFVGEEVTDSLRLVGAILASILFAPLVILSIVIGRWSASKHYAGALMAELHSAGRCVYRIAIGNLARLLGISKALEGVEQRVPEMMAAAPTRDKPTKRVGMFDGYKIVGSLKGGGSGGKLYIAEPDEVKQAVFAKRKLENVDQVVIKVFSLKDGSSLPQIVRESRALDAARQLGLVLEHQMAPERFYYVMRYVPGQSLSQVTQQLHALSSIKGLENEHLKSVMGYAEDLLIALDTYHNAELWHKDVKPDNIIVDGHGTDASAHLVDFGLITPMRSAMTLTTHGTEYFRDPELVRQALRGVKVHQIDGSKFDVYGAGAVMFSMIENSFPAHGGLSQLTKRCPEALRWIVRRAMAEYDRRYPSAAVMLADLRVVLNAEDPFELKPIHLPSVSQGDVAAAEQVDSVNPPSMEMPINIGGSPVPPRQGAQGGARVNAPMDSRVGRPKAVLTSWWSGKYKVGGVVSGADSIADEPALRGMGKVNNPRKRVRPVAPSNPTRVERPLRDRHTRQSANDQVKNARKRAHEMRQRAGVRVKKARSGRKSYENTPGLAVIFGGLLGLFVSFAGVVGGMAIFTNVFHNDDYVATPQPPVTPMVQTHTGDGHQGEFSIKIDGQSVSLNYGAEEIEHVEHVEECPECLDDAHIHADGHGVHADRLVDASVLIVPLLTSSIDPVEIQVFKEHLSVHGVEILDGDDSIELSAQLHSAIGAIPVDSPELSDRVREWLGDQDFDGVLVIASSPDKDHANAIFVMDELRGTMPYTSSTAEHLINMLIDHGYGLEG